MVTVVFVHQNHQWKGANAPVSGSRLGRDADGNVEGDGVRRHRFRRAGRRLDVKVKLDAVGAPPGSVDGRDPKRRTLQAFAQLYQRHGYGGEFR